MIQRAAQLLADSASRAGDRPVSRRSFLAAGGALAGGLLVAGCGGGSSSTTTAASGPRTLTYWTIDSFTTQGDGLAKAVKRYHQANPDVTIKVQAFSPGVYHDKLITAIQGGSGPDVAAIDSAWVAEFAAAQAIEDLSARYKPLTGQFFDGAAATGTFQGKQYAVPWYTNNVGLYYNRSLFQKAGIKAPPATWDELRSIGKELTGGDQYGLMLGANWYGPFLWWPFLWQNGGEIVDGDGTQAAFASPQGVEAWQFYADLYLKDKIVPETFLGVNGDWDQYMKPFMQGKVAMMMTGDWGLYMVDTGAPHLDYGVAPLPAGRQQASIVGGYDLVIPRGSSDVDGSWDFLKWLTAAPQEWVMASYERTPARKDVEGQAKFTKGKAGVFAKQAQVARARPVVPKWSQVENSAMADAWDATIHRKQSPADAIKAAAEQASSVLSA